MIPLNPGLMLRNRLATQEGMHQAVRPSKTNGSPQSWVMDQLRMDIQFCGEGSEVWPQTTEWTGWTGWTLGSKSPLVGSMWNPWESQAEFWIHQISRSVDFTHLKKGLPNQSTSTEPLSPIFWDVRPSRWLSPKMGHKISWVIMVPRSFLSHLRTFWGVHNGTISRHIQMCTLVRASKMMNPDELTMASWHHVMVGLKICSAPERRWRHQTVHTVHGHIRKIPGNHWDVQESSLSMRCLIQWFRWTGDTCTSALNIAEKWSPDSQEKAVCHTSSDGRSAGLPAMPFVPRSGQWFFPGAWWMSPSLSSVSQWYPAVTLETIDFSIQ